MTLPPVIRIFFAIDLPESIKVQLGEYINSLKKKSKSRAIRWTKPQNLHITLHFLPEVNREHLPSLIEEVHTTIEGIASNLVLEFGQLQLFPNPFRPRVIVLEILAQPVLQQLANKLGQAITAQSYEIEDRPFRAHLTLGRIKHRNVELDFLNGVQQIKLDKIKVQEIILFRSEPQPDGSRYSVLQVIPLEPAPATDALQSRIL